MQHPAKRETLPEGWRLMRLGDVAEVVTGNTPPRDVHEYYGGNVPWVKPSDLASSRLVDSSEEGLTDAGVAVAKRVPQNCVLVSCIGTIGEVAISTVPLCFNQQINALIPNDSVWPPFLYWACSAQSNYLLSISAKTAVPILNKSAFSAVPILLPPLPEQQAIAGVLDSIDEAIEGAGAVIAATEQLRDSLLHQLLTRGVPGWHTEWKDVPGLGTMPADWAVVRLGEVVPKFEYGTSVKSQVESLGTPILRIPNIARGELDLDDLKYAKLRSDELTNLQLRAGDILLVRTNGNPDICGQCWVVEGLEGEWAFASYIVRGRPDKSRVNPIFAGYFLKSETGRRLLRGHIRTSAGNYNLSVGDMGSLSLPCPTLDEQEIIANTVEGLNQSIKVACAERDHLRLLKESTAGALLTGRVPGLVRTN